MHSLKQLSSFFFPGLAGTIVGIETTDYTIIVRDEQEKMVAIREAKQQWFMWYGNWCEFINSIILEWKRKGEKTSSSSSRPRRRTTAASSPTKDSSWSRQESSATSQKHPRSSQPPAPANSYKPVDSSPNTPSRPTTSTIWNSKALPSQCSSKSQNLSAKTNFKIWSRKRKLNQTATPKYQLANKLAVSSNGISSAITNSS